MAVSILFRQRQQLIKQLGITVILQSLFPIGFGPQNKIEITIWQFLVCFVDGPLVNQPPPHNTTTAANFNYHRFTTGRPLDTITNEKLPHLCAMFP